MFKWFGNRQQPQVEKTKKMRVTLHTGKAGEQIFIELESSDETVLAKLANDAFELFKTNTATAAFADQPTSSGELKVKFMGETKPVELGRFFGDMPPGVDVHFKRDAAPEPETDNAPNPAPAAVPPAPVNVTTKLPPKPFVRPANPVVASTNTAAEGKNPMSEVKGVDKLLKLVPTAKPTSQLQEQVNLIRFSKEEQSGYITYKTRYHCTNPGCGHGGFRFRQADETPFARCHACGEKMRMQPATSMCVVDERNGLTVPMPDPIDGAIFVAVTPFEEEGDYAISR